MSDLPSLECCQRLLPVVLYVYVRVRLGEDLLYSVLVLVSASGGPC